MIKYATGSVNIFPAPIKTGYPIVAERRKPSGRFHLAIVTERRKPSGSVNPVPHGERIGGDRYPTDRRACALALLFFLPQSRMPGHCLFGPGEAEQQVAVVFVLLLPQLDLAGQAFSQRIGQRVELVEDRDNAGLLSK